MKKDKNFKIVNEIMNDAFWLGYILEIKRNITDYSQKEILSSFLVFFSSIFVEETLKSNHGGLTENRNVTLEEIENLRNYNLKYCPSSNSKTSQKIIKEMGIDFNTYMFDVILYLNESELLDINLRNWELNKKENFELLDGIVSTPIRWIEILMPEIYDALKEALKSLSGKYINKISNSKINKKTYSSFKLFRKSVISESGKLYILQRYGLIKSTLFIESIIDDDISFNIGKLHFNFKNFMMKAKAIILEMFWNDKKTNSSINLIDEIFEKNRNCIDDKFYPINRKCRNNLHYSDYHYLSKKDIDVLNKYQNLYLNNALSVFDSNITYKFNKLYKVFLAIAKLEYWSRPKSLKEDKK